MRNGDLVRFREREVHYDMGGAIEGIGPWSIGLLVEYHPWEKIAATAGTALHYAEPAPMQ